ncbi:hypothetical protein [Pantanalinema sp. GBBB05]|uniref:hypothetical protein n=1 Tax=Pantanalinema sp. GBBB05 TaxID=2604139 RepID=UPI003D81C212
MTWLEIAEIDLSAQWQLTPVTVADIFRFGSVGNLYSHFAIAHALADSEGEITDLAGVERIQVLNFRQILALPKPEYFSDRRLAIRGIIPAIGRNITPLILTIEASDMPLSNPSSVTVTPATASTATPTSVTAATTNTQLLALNTNRKGATVWNNSTAQLYLELGGTASATVYTAKLEAGGYYEVPFGYTGAIAGLWTAANGNALVRELT